MSQYFSVLRNGLYNQEVSSTSNVTTTSGSDVLVTGMTSTPPAGTYLVLYSTWLTHSNGNATVTMTYYVGGSAKTDSVRTIIPFLGVIGGITQDIPAVLNGIVTVDGTQAIEVKWKTNTGTATAHQMTLDLIKIG